MRRVGLSILRIRTLKRLRERSSLVPDNGLRHVGQSRLGERTEVAQASKTRLQASAILVACITSLVIVAAAVTAPRHVARTSADSDPIVGFWNYGGGVVQVVGSGSSFTGTVVKESAFSSCTHPVGEVIWRITKTTTGYTGTHEWFANTACTPGGSNDLGQSTWGVTETGAALVLHFCTTSPTEPSDTRCNDLTRAKPVVTTTTTPTTTAGGAVPVHLRPGRADSSGSTAAAPTTVGRGRRER